MKARQIYKNAIKCKKCGDVIESFSRHDFKMCKCGACGVDGGFDYLRRVGDPNDWEDASVVEDVVVEPKWNDVFRECHTLKPYIFKNGYECSSYGYFDYEGKIYPIYSDDYGCSDFIVYRYYDENGEAKEYLITVQNMAGILDWAYELDRIRNIHPKEVVLKLEDFCYRC